MGLTSFAGELPALKDIGIAKNYLNEDELKILNNLVSGYFDLAEISAIEHRPMYMSDYVEQLECISNLADNWLGLVDHYGDEIYNDKRKKLRNEREISSKELFSTHLISQIKTLDVY